jgi:PAP2 superfamily protein
MVRDEDWMLPAAAIAAFVAACAAVLSFITKYPDRPGGMTSLRAALAVVAATAFFRFLKHLLNLWRGDEDHPIARMRHDFWPSIRAFKPIAIGVLILSVFLYSITFLKSMIPSVVPFWADMYLAPVDRILHINAQAIAIHLKPYLTSLGLFYGLWHAAHLGGIIWVIHWRNGNKSRHIISFMLTWTIGMTLAYFFSSMGPIFAGAYDPKVAPESVRKAASFLWMNYRAEGAWIGGGISAFPSMHVAIAAWLAIVMKDRNLAWLGISYFIGVFSCSVILGWHYVIDGAAGAAIAIAADRISRLWFRRSTESNAEVRLAAAT